MDKKNKKTSNSQNKITRKEALKKGGKVTLLTATSMLMLTTKSHAAGSEPPVTGSGYRGR